MKTTIDYLSQLFETNGIAHQIQDDKSLTIDIADDRNRSFVAEVAVMDYGNAVGFSSTPFELRQRDPKTYELVKSVLLGINFQNNSNIYCGLNDQTRSIKVFTKIPLIGWSMLQADDLKNIFFEYLEFIEGVGDILEEAQSGQIEQQPLNPRRPLDLTKTNGLPDWMVQWLRKRYGFWWLGLGK